MVLIILIVFHLLLNLHLSGLLISLAATHHWPLHQLDVRNGFPHGALKEVYIEQPLGFIAQGSLA